MIQLTKKICLIGDFAVGKTSMVRQFVEGRFSESYLSTLGVRVSRRVIQAHGDAPAQITLMIWDTAGSESFNSVVQNYYRGASGAILVCDLTREETLGALSRYAQDFRGVNPGVPLVLVGNKADLAGQRVVSDEQIGLMAGTYGAPWLLSSAKTGMQVEEAFQALGTLIISHVA
ncbi:GTP-binding protein [Oscillochloris sp. ZM17-4]|uniref:Rab family GTPase n=1 Tax=Oscillochloris sp. ZM17-4 TaxID=2866714 RepID=UPI001C7387A5|nr:Rab family GTPase [Oscillochloris sp. ZM17-4]MBX0329623.1 GTP-binding protein [Oscillochloris sp. ZM17-4]